MLPLAMAYRFNITWSFIEVGYAFSFVKREDVAEYVNELLERKRETKPIKHLLLALLDAGDDGEYRSALHKLTVADGGDDPVEIRKWRLLLFMRLTDELAFTEPDEGRARLKQFYSSVGMPWKLYLYTMDKPEYRDMLNACVEWASDEYCRVSIRTTQKSDNQQAEESN